MNSNKYKEIADSSAVEQNLEQQKDTRFITGDLDIKDKIINLQKCQKRLKEAIIQTDVVLKSPYMQYRQSILQQSAKRQKVEFQIFTVQYKNLTSQQRRPYDTMFRKFKQKINEHKQQIRLAIEQPEQHKKKLESIRQVWFQNEQMQEQEWKFLLRGFLGIFGAFLFHIVIGAFGRWNLINIYVTSYYKITTDPHIQTKYNSFVSALTMLCMGITMKWGFNQCNIFGPIKVLLISVFGMAASLFAASFVDEFLEFVALNNCLFGFFAGVAFLSPMKETHKYFPKYKLICNSIILVGTGMGGVIFGLFNVNCMNSKHEKPLDTGYFAGQKQFISRHLPTCWQQMSIVVLIIGILATICFYPMLVYNNKQQQIKLQKGELPDFQNSCYTDEEALKSKVFWALTSLVLCCTIGNFFMNLNYKNAVKGQTDPIFKNQDYLVMILVSGAICGAFFRLPWGLVFRKIGFKYTFILAVSLDISVYISMLLVPLNQITYMLIFSLHQIVLGGYMVIFPNVCLLIFGDIIGESIYTFYWVFFSLANFIQYLIGLNLNDIANFVKNKINQNLVPNNIYKIVNIPFIILCLTALLICIFVKYQGRWQNNMKLLTFKCQ